MSRGFLRDKGFFLAFNLFGLILFAQNNVTREIPALSEIIIVDHTPALSSYKAREYTDELEEYTSYKLGDLLKEKSSVFVKEYGKGQLQSISFRGTGASQTQVYWNGLVVNSPSLGQTDLSLFPTFFLDKVELNYGNSSIVKGSGGLGGSIQMQNAFKWKKGISTEAAHQFASFSNHTSTFKVGLVNKRLNFAQEVKVYRATGKNDFSFIDISQPTSPLVKQQNNEYKQEGLQYLVGTKSRDNSKYFNVGVLYFNSNRNLPTIIGASKKGESQTDEHLRGFISVKLDNLLSYKLTLNPIIGLVSENMVYKDSSSGLVSNARFLSTQPQLKLMYRSSSGHIVDAVFLGNMITAKSDGFDSDMVKRREFSALGKWKKKVRRLNLDLFVRQTMIDKKLMPFTFGSGFSYKLSYKYYSLLKLSLSKNFRYPTLNDLYWNPGGNKELKPENSYTGELGYIGLFNSYRLKIEGNIFYGIIDNWIQWMPTASSYWSPLNIRKVNNYGGEFTTSYRWFLPQDKELNFSLDYGYNNSIVKESTIVNDNSVGKQLIYVPQHKASFTTKFVTDYFTLSYTQMATSKVYIDATNSIYLPGYIPANILLSSKLLLNKYYVEFNLAANNIYNEPYHVVANRPVPGRNYSVTIRLGYN